MRITKNRGKLKKDLLTSILKSESNAERNYMKHFIINTNLDNDNNNTNNDDEDTYDGKIRDKISDIRMILSRLGNTITINNRKKIKKELYEIENKKNLPDMEKEKIDDDLAELVRTIDKKWFDAVNNDYYYKPILVKSSFKENYR